MRWPRVSSSRWAMLRARPGTRASAQPFTSGPRSSTSTGASGWLAGVICTTISPPPAGKKPRRLSCSSSPAPRRRTSGANARSRKSYGGAIGLCVPPTSSTLLSPSASINAGSTVCSTSRQLPAVAIWKRYSPAHTAPGVNRSVCEPSSAPSACPPHTDTAACTQARCWRMRPGLGRPARMRVMCSGRPVTMDRARPVRRIWPPPSPVAPSRVRGTLVASVMATPPRLCGCCSAAPCPAAAHRARRAPAPAAVARARPRCAPVRLR